MGINVTLMFQVSVSLFVFFHFHSVEHRDGKVHYTTGYATIMQRCVLKNTIDDLTEFLSFPKKGELGIS